ncbi:putative RNA helicase [Helianthus annuus]|nr:putative RNA helicase [Helianthus annuus]
MYSLDVVQISRVQAKQRAGRAGRTRPGKCYRLYPLGVYHDNLLDATVPEIQRSSLAGSVLYLKSLDLPDIDVLKFDFLDPRSLESLQDALKQLFLIDAIDENGTITRIGKTMSELPLEPSLARTLIEANKYDCLTQAITGNNGLSVVVIIEAEDLVKLSEPCDLDKSFAISQSIQEGCTIITILHENIYSSEDGFTFPLQMEYLADITINRAFDNRVGSRCSRAGICYIFCSHSPLIVIVVQTWNIVVEKIVIFFAHIHR